MPTKTKLAVREREKNTQRDSKYSEVIGKRVLEDKLKTKEAQKTV